MLEENLELLFLVIFTDCTVGFITMWDKIFGTFFKRRRVANPRETHPFTSLGALKEEIEVFFQVPNGGFVDDHVSF